MFVGKEGREASQALARFGGMGCSLAAGIAVFAWVGYRLDQRFGTEPTWLAVFGLLGAVLGLYKVVRDVTLWSREEDERQDS